MVAQNGVVEHIRGGEDEVGVFANPAAFAGGGVPVVAGRVKPGKIVGGEGGELVCGECLRRRNIKNIRSVIEAFSLGIRGCRAHWFTTRSSVNGVQCGHQIAQGLARCCARGNDNVPAATRSLRVRATRRGHLAAGRSCGVPTPPAVAGGARRQRRIKTRVGRLRGGDLVSVWLRNAERFEGLHHARMHPLRPGGVLRLAGRDSVHVSDLLG